MGVSDKCCPKQKILVIIPDFVSVVFQESLNDRKEKARE